MLPSRADPLVPERPNPYHGHRFPPEVIAHAVRLFLRLALSVRDAEEILAERGIAVRYGTVRRQGTTLGAEYADALRRRALGAGRPWHPDETATIVGGQRPWRWRAVDERGQTVDVLLHARRDTAAAARFFRRRVTVTDGVPRDRLTTDKLGSHAAAVSHVAEVQLVKHLQAGSAVRRKHRVGQAHQPTRVRERVMRRCKSVEFAQQFLDAFTRVGDLVRPRRHPRAAAAYRATMCERTATWREVAGLRAA